MDIKIGEAVGNVYAISKVNGEVCMNIQDIQNDAAARVERNKWSKNLETRCYHLNREYEELAVELDAAKPDEAKIAYEMFDMIWNICAVANLLGITLTPHFVGKVEEFDRRESEAAERQVNPWEDDPDFPPTAWFDEVRNGDTRLGYVDWCKHKREAEGFPPA